MRFVFAVFILLIAHAASYPSHRQAASDDDDSDLELELRSILDHLNDDEEADEQMTRAASSEDDEDDYQMSKRQGGHNVIDQQSKCEIVCINKERNPEKGKGKTVKEAAKACRGICNAASKKRGGKKVVAPQARKTSKLNSRSFQEEDDAAESNEEQQERRDFLELLQERLEQDS